MTTHRKSRSKHQSLAHQVPLTVDRTYELADLFLQALAPLAGNDVQVDSLCRRWFDTYGDRFGPICMASIRTVFVDCLSPADPPGDGLTFSTDFQEVPHV